MDKYLSPYLYGYRKAYCTQQVLISTIEKFRKIIDKKGNSMKHETKHR